MINNLVDKLGTNFLISAVHYGDILAIPFFILLSVYFYKIKNKTFIEYILFIFAIGGTIVDIIFTINFLGLIK
jgi:hypothetical protein